MKRQWFAKDARWLVTLVICVVIAAPSAWVRAQPAFEIVTADEALIVAQNWVALITKLKGDWGGAHVAEVTSVQELKRGERVLGYFCVVKPQGFVVISPHKEMVPVKAYSATSDFDPTSDEGMADLIKGGLESALVGLEAYLSSPGAAPSLDSERAMKLAHWQDTWQHLTTAPQVFERSLTPGAGMMNYQAGEVMLTSAWHQYPPYNDQCPDGGCDRSDYCDFNDNVKVGCTAVAGGQIMRYWNWPPYGVSPYSDTYDWPNMPDAFTDPGATVPGCAWPMNQVNAVAELLAEVGEACGMSYGCSASACPGRNMETVYEDYYRYANLHVIERVDYATAGAWFDEMKAQFDVNRPLQYRFETSSFSHGIVGDGWQEIGSPPVQQWHVNYGHGDAASTWYAVDHWYNAGDDEYMLIDIYPAQALGSVLVGAYPRVVSFSYRYFDQDTTGGDVIFSSGQNLQFLPDVIVTCDSTPGSFIRFNGSSVANTRLFTRGDLSSGILINDGSIELSPNGSITFR